MHLNGGLRCANPPCVLIWFLASFPRPPEGAEGPAINYSLAAMIGSLLQPRSGR